jgi:hypothetical protein
MFKEIFYHEAMACGQLSGRADSKRAVLTLL